jgi:LysR family hydrogen peroxide-inducible transcriptional activator
LFFRDRSKKSMSALPTLKQLRYLVTLADERHFGRAAAACHVTQSTLSTGIRELETVLQAPLVDRTTRSVVFTPLGEETVGRAREILSLAEDLAETVRAGAEPLAGPLHLGVIPTISPFLLPRIMPALRRALPKLQLYLREDMTHRLVAEVEDGRLDAAMLALPCDCEPLETVTLFEDPFLAACRRDHPLARLAQVPLDAMSGESLLLLQDGHCLREHALAACGLADRRQRSAFEATSLHTLVQMVDNGLGVTLLPKLALDAGILEGTELVARPLGGDGSASRGIGLGWRRGTRRAAEFRLLAERIAEADAATAPAANSAHEIPAGAG